MPRDWRISPHSETVSTSRGWSAVAGLAARQHGVVGLEQLRRSGIAAATVRTWVARHRLVPHVHRRLRRRACGAAARRTPARGGARLRRRGGALTRIGCRSLGDQAKRGSRHRCDGAHPDRSRAGRAANSLRRAAAAGRDDRRRRRALHDRWSHAARSGGRPPRARTRRCHRDERAPRAAGPERRRDPARPTSTVDAAPGGCAGRSPCLDPELVRARSETEARFYCLCVDAGLPRPLVNRPVGQGERSYEADLHWPAARVILEVDSPYHDTTAARIRDRARDD